MSITDELREYVGNFYLFRYKDVREKLNEIADRIDAEHKKACDDAWDNGYEADYLGIEKWLTEHPQVMEHHGWMRPPVDADGVPIHVGDVMEWVDEPGITRTVTSIQLANDGWWVYISGTGRRPDKYRHHHAPTVEDVLREMADRIYADEDEPRSRDAIVAEYAQRLRLAGDE